MFRRRARNRKSSKPNRFHPSLEHLGSRIVPATASFANNIITVTCANGGDTATLSSDVNGNILLNGNAIAGGPTKR